LSGAVFAGTAALAIAFEVHARSLQGALVARGFTPSTCATGQPAAGSADCEEIASRMTQRDIFMSMMFGTGVVTGLLAIGAAIAFAGEPRGPTLTPVASTNGGGLILQGTW
jgi:hypothetical protein